MSDGTCRCPAGLHGHECAEYCPVNKYGVDCKFQCTCGEFSKSCHPVSGACVCAPGFMGSSCNTVCPTNTYGIDCKNTCSCDEAKGEICNPIVGCCVKGKSCPQVESHAPIISESNATNTGVVVPVVVVLFIILVLVLALLVVYYRRKYKREKDPDLPTVRYNTSDYSTSTIEKNEFDNPLYDPVAQKGKQASYNRSSFPADGSSSSSAADVSHVNPKFDAAFNNTGKLRINLPQTAYGDDDSVNESIYADADYPKGKTPYSSVTSKNGHMPNGTNPYEHITREAVPNIYATPNEHQKQPFSSVEKDLQAMQGYKS